MAKTKTKTKEKTLYEKISAEAELEYSAADYESVQDYKIELVEHFGGLSEAEFDELDEDIQTWVNEATEIWNANNKKDEDDHEPLTPIAGLTEPEVDKADETETEIEDEEAEEDEEEEKPARRAKDKTKEKAETKTKSKRKATEDEDEEDEKPAKKKSKAKAEKQKKEVVKRDPDDNRFAAVIPHVMKNRKVSTDDVMEAVNGKGGKQYEKITLDRAMLATRSVLDWFDRHGYEVRRTSK